MTGLSPAGRQVHPVYAGNARRGHIARMVLAGIALLLPAAATQVMSDAGGRDVLKGITRIGVEVEDLPRMAEKLGIKNESLNVEVASRLRQAGIEVAGDDVLKENPSLPFLKVSLIIGYSKPTYIYAVVVGLNEKVSLERDPRIISYAMPWWRIVKGEHAGESAIAGCVQETLVYIINEFIADYNAANPEVRAPNAKKNDQEQGAQHNDNKEKSENIGREMK
jgi:hypothetical protein